jgi:hypothetical protein
MLAAIVLSAIMLPEVILPEVTHSALGACFIHC